MLVAIAFPLHWLWEMVQAPLYAGMLQKSWYAATRLCTIASVGDVFITLVAYAIVAALVKGRFWAFPLRSSPLQLSQSRPRYRSVAVRRIGLYLVIGIVITAIAEFVNISVLHRWEYGPAMPRLLGFGVTPLAQWIIVPILILWLSRRVRFVYAGQEDFTRALP
ncbi:MAG: hypothetical protein ABI026_10965 [Gemmatimonadaceae bacterium]